jgi:N-acetylmuramoyl-L-alanine amidase/putative methionine-R-sulfoxide reductase with GAF domain
MATTPTKPLEVTAVLADVAAPMWLRDGTFPVSDKLGLHKEALFETDSPSGRDALQALLAFSALHQHVRQRRALALRHNGFETIAKLNEFEPQEQFVLDEVLQLVADRAVAITGADGLGIALAEQDEIVLRASAGTIKPDVGARIQRDSAFSGACFRTAQIIRCDDTETDDRVNLYACRQLGARSMVAVPLCGRRRVIGLLEAFSAEPFGFNDSDVSSLELLAELIVGALKPEDEDRFAQSAQIAEAKLEEPRPATAVPAQPTRTDLAVTALEPAPKKHEEARDLSNADLSIAVRAVVHPPIADVAIIGDETIGKTATETSSNDTLLTNQERPGTDQVRERIAETELFQEAESLKGHPGIVLILVLIVVAALLGAGLWWKLKNAQLGAALVGPVQDMSEIAVPAAKMPTPTAAPSTPSPSANSATSSIVTPGSQPSSTAATDAQSTFDATEPAANDIPQDQLARLPRVTGVRHWSSAESSTVVLDLEDQVQYEAHRLANPDRIYFDLHDTSLAPAIEGKTIEIGDGLLVRVRMAQPSSSLSRVVLETKGSSTFSVSLEPNPYRLVVQVRKAGADTKTQTGLFPARDAHQQNLAIVVPPPTKDDLQLRAHMPRMRIVVDAGHGGWDLGTVGRRGLLEKDVVLEIAQRLGKLLESRLGAEVILTRNDDNYIPLDERAAIANQVQADLFISVHANYSDLPSARGVETYYTNFFSTPNAKDVETRNSSKSPITVALSSADLHERIEQSRRLAASVQRTLYGALAAQNPGLRDRGVKEASYVVLTETAMPGILAEVSFVSSPTDEQKLRSDGYREQIAEALYLGIARYAANSHPVKMAAR